MSKTRSTTCCKPKTGLSSDAVATANDFVYLSKEQHGLCFMPIMCDVMLTLFD